MAVNEAKHSEKKNSDNILVVRVRNLPLHDLVYICTFSTTPNENWKIVSLSSYSLIYKLS